MNERLGWCGVTAATVGGRDRNSELPGRGFATKPSGIRYRCPRKKRVSTLATLTNGSLELSHLRSTTRARTIVHEPNLCIVAAKTSRTMHPTLGANDDGRKEPRHGYRYDAQR